MYLPNHFVVSSCTDVVDGGISAYEERRRHALNVCSGHKWQRGDGNLVG